MSAAFAFVALVSLAITVLIVVRLFAGTDYRAGTANNWTQRNDLRRETRGSDNEYGGSAEPSGGSAE